LVAVTVRVHLHTTLQRRTSKGPLRRLEVTLPSGSTLGDLLERLALSRCDDSVLLVINGRQAETGYVLQDTDEVHLIPALSGGAPG